MGRQVGSLEEGISVKTGAGERSCGSTTSAVISVGKFTPENQKYCFVLCKCPRFEYFHFWKCALVCSFRWLKLIGETFCAASDVARLCAPLPPSPAFSRPHDPLFFVKGKCYAVSSEIFTDNSLFIF